MRCFFLFVLSLFIGIILSVPADAQILNIERSRVSRDSADYFTGKAGLNFSMFNRNAGKDNPNNYLQLTFNGDLAYVSGLHSYLLLNSYNYLLVNYTSKEQRNTVASTGYAHFRVNLLRKRRLSYELFTQAQTDKARGLDLRTLAGGGVRVGLRRQKQLSLFAGSGLMHEHEEWDSPVEGEGIRVSDLLKSTNYVSLKASVNDHVTAASIVYYQFGYDAGIDRLRNRVSGEVSLAVKLGGRLSLNTSFSCTYEDKPVVPVTRFVYALTNGVQVQF